MREIEKKMVRAAKYGQPFHGNNTVVHNDGSVYLHGNHIATVHTNGIVTVNLDTLRRWPTPTTMSRLRALSVPVYQKNWNVYIGDREIWAIPEDTLDVSV